jgi:hypothetical protein
MMNLKKPARGGRHHNGNESRLLYLKLKGSVIHGPQHCLGNLQTSLETIAPAADAATRADALRDWNADETAWPNPHRSGWGIDAEEAGSTHGASF